MTTDEPEEDEEDGAEEVETYTDVHLGVDDDPSIGGEYGIEVLEEEDILVVAGLSSEDPSDNLGLVEAATVQGESTGALSLRLGADEQVWLEWIREVDEDLANAIETYLNDCVRGILQPVLPKPNGQIDVKFKDKFDIDLFFWLGSYNDCKKNNEKTIGEIGKKPPLDAKKAKRGPYKCRICGDMQKSDGKPHSCRPTRYDVVDEVVRQLSGRGKRRAVSGNANKSSRKNLCGKCHHPKTECSCLDEYGRLARIVRSGDNLQRDRDLIGTEIDNSIDFMFSEVDGRRNRVDYDANIHSAFVGDHAPADAGLRDGDPVDFGLPPRALPLQSYEHMEELRQDGALSQVSASRFGLILCTNNPFKRLVVFLDHLGRPPTKMPTVTLVRLT